MIKRENILKRIRPFYENELIKVLIGLRRSGKSVLLHQIMDELLQAGVKKEQIIYMNFEDFQYSSITNAQQLYEYICDKRQNEEKRMACGWERPEARRPGQPQKGRLCGRPCRIASGFCSYQSCSIFRIVPVDASISMSYSARL